MKLFVFVFLSSVLFASTPKEKSLIDDTRNLKREWQKISVSPATDNLVINRETLDKIAHAHLQYSQSIKFLLKLAILKKDFSNSNSLWNRLILDNDFHYDMVVTTFQNINILSNVEQEIAIDKIVKSLNYPELSKFKNSTISYILTSNLEVMKNHDNEIVTHMLNSKELPLLLFCIDSNDKRIDDYLLNEAKNFSKYLKENKFDAKSYISLCILARRNNSKALNEVISHTKSMPIKNNLSLQIIPLGLGLINQEETTQILIKMLDSNIKVYNGECIIPQYTQLNYSAAISLGIMAKDFPQYSTFDSFENQDREKCLAFLNNNKIIFNKNSWQLFYEETTLQMIK